MNKMSAKESIGKTARYFFMIIGITMIALVIFVRAGQRGGKSGGEQAGLIIEAGTTGLTQIINAATGAEV